MSFSVVYYSNNSIDKKILDYCLDSLTNQLKLIAKAELILVTWESIPNQENNLLWEKSSCPYRNIYGQISLGLSSAKYNTIFLAEHDVLYPDSHFDLRNCQEIQEGKIVFNSNVYHLTKSGIFKAQGCNFLSTLVSDKNILAGGIRAKLRELNSTGQVLWCEPEGINGYKRIEGKDPVLDIRHTRNLTGTRESDSYIEKIAMWDSKVLINQIF
jgi:hypothetical protein